MDDGIDKALKGGFFTGQVKPRERLIEKDLHAQFNVSRFSVRKAISELARKGLVEIVPQKGARVIDISEKEVEDNYLLPMNLDC